MCELFTRNFADKVLEKLDQDKILYVVTRDYSYDFDKCSTTWNILFISKSLSAALDFKKSYGDIEFGKLNLCKIPMDQEIDVIRWEQYKVNPPLLKLKIHRK